jgi:hypothetical protein
MHLRLLVFNIVIALTVASVASADSPARAPQWEQFDQEDGIRMYRRDVPGSDVVALRGDGFVAAPITRVASVFLDRKRSTEWIDRLAKAKVIRRISDTEQVEWDHIKTPTPLKDRDFVVKTRITTDPAKKQVIFTYQSVTDPLAPETSDYVRGTFHNGKFELTMGTRKNADGTVTKGTIVSAEVEVDPRGSVPKFIVNMVQKSWPYQTLTSLRKQVAKPDIKEDQRVVERLTREGFFQ